LTVEKTPNRSTIGGVPLIDPPGEARGSLRAFDAVTGEQKWVFMSDASMLAGITPTSSGVLLTGTGNGDFLVFEAGTGRELYRFYTGGAIAGGPSTYLVGGKQLIAVASGNDSKSGWKIDGAATVIVFGLP
jgi:alcohol dehydrogenase (cytochrome c)